MIYLDYNATTPCDEKVLEKMLPYFREKFGNAASRTHAFGWTADAAVEQARAAVAHLINAEKEEIIFTSGATEACNLAIKGVFDLFNAVPDDTPRNHIITSITEHKAVLDTCAAMEQKGAQVTYLPVNSQGLIDIAELQTAIRPETILVAIMYANNETGTLQPIAEIGNIAKENKVWFFCDATQAVGKIPLDVQVENIDLLAMSAHKIYGPKGVGALYVRRRNPRVRLVAQMDGGGHERAMRSGTLNVPGIVGLGAAADLSKAHIDTDNTRIDFLRNKLEQGLLKISGTVINGSDIHRLPNVCNIAFVGIKAERLISRLNHQIAFSVGSACTSAAQSASHVLVGMGLDERVIEGSVRFSLGRFTTSSEIDQTIELISKEVLKLQQENSQH